jgi:hypothetical protein
MITCFNDGTGLYISFVEAHGILDNYIKLVSRYFNRNLDNILGINSKRYNITMQIEKLSSTLKAIRESRKLFIISQFFKNVEFYQIKKITDELDCIVMELNKAITDAIEMDMVEDLRRG